MKSFSLHSNLFIYILRVFCHLFCCLPALPGGCFSLWLRLALVAVGFFRNVKYMEISLQVCACEWCFRRPCCLLRQMRHSRGCCRKPLSCCGLPPAFGILCLAMGGVAWFFRCKKGNKCGLFTTSASLATMHYGLYCKAERAVWCCGGGRLASGRVFFRDSACPFSSCRTWNTAC